MRSRATLLSVTAAALLCGLTACGGSAPAPNGAASQRQQMVDASRSLIACLRQNGYPNAPDPTFDDHGNPSFPPGSEANLPTSVDLAPAACHRQVQRVLSLQRNDNNGGNGGPTAADRRLGRQLAQCLRQHGLTDWPDPNSDGTWTMPPDLQNKNPATASAMQHCNQYLPSGRIYGR
jgi:hypothetical protein